MSDPVSEARATVSLRKDSSSDAGRSFRSLFVSSHCCDLFQRSDLEQWLNGFMLAADGFL